MSKLFFLFVWNNKVIKYKMDSITVKKQSINAALGNFKRFLVRRNK